MLQKRVHSTACGKTADSIANQIGREAASVEGVQCRDRRSASPWYSTHPTVVQYCSDGHLLSLAILDVTETDDVLECNSIIQQSADGVKQ
jgi:hypothetical protein